MPAKFKGFCARIGPRGKSSSLYGLFAFFTDPIIQFILGGVFALKQWIISSLKHDIVPRVNNLYCFYVKNPPKRMALWDRENSQLESTKKNWGSHAFFAR